MPHLVILYTSQLDAEVNMTALCRQMADAMLSVKAIKTFRDAAATGAGPLKQESTKTGSN